MALDELAYKGLTDAQSRRKFLKKMGIMGGGLMALGLVGENLAFGVAVANAADNDIQTVQFAYILENVAVDAYKTAAGSGLLSQDLVAVGTKFAGQHADHANALKAALTSNNAQVPAVPTKINYPAFKTQEDILKFALALESAAVGAYYTAGGAFTNRDLASAAASIVGVEATHVALLSSALKMDPLPTAFVVGTPFDQVQATANSLLGAGGQGGGTAPASMPNSGFGGKQSSSDFSGAGFGIAGLLTVAAGAALALSRRKATGETQTTGEDANRN
jgi:rubrerythrin